VNGVWTPDADVTDTLTQVPMLGLYATHGAVEIYDNTTNSVGNSSGR